ncbi:polysaccharide deacetylase family protein [Frankia sp. AgB32]|uniref:polysaccharide deacetylase family protein n=1 Tax=Frankia sp. AgB32 TaxID=631119 RepID=UPI00200E17AF|nr:polysaccharide deacetylase family protein [Frankia sp. AgB32]MCK9893055.1 polysaccharide deacetylase family protein [Frankia sp. AgB32]
MSASRRQLIAGAMLGALTGCAASGPGASRHGAPRGPAAAGRGGPGTRVPAGGPRTISTGLPALPAVPSRASIVARYGGLAPHAWGLHLPGTMGTLPPAGKVLALTFDACGGPGGSGYDHSLVTVLRRYAVPATLFLNARWIDANRPVFATLAADPLFEIGNHGTRHRPLSTTGRSAYGIAGSRDCGEAYDEVAGNHAKLTALLGAPPRFFRPGTAFCDDVAVRIVGELDETVVAFAVNGDGGATFTPAQVTSALLTAPVGSIVIGHMNHPGRGTARGVAAALPRLLDAGFRFVHLPPPTVGPRSR